MAIVVVTEEWSAPSTLSEKTLISVNYGTVLLALGSAVPSAPNDGIPLRGGFMGVFDAGTVVRFRTQNDGRRSQVYMGPVA